MPLPPFLGELALRSAAPGAVLPWLERLWEERLGDNDGGRGGEGGGGGGGGDGSSTDWARRDGGACARRLVAVGAASRSLSRLLLSDPEALEVLASDEPLPPVGGAGSPTELARRKQLELLRIAVLDLTGAVCVDEVAELLAGLADEVLIGACRLADAGALAVIGMGKHGACELNYASDVDILFVGTGRQDDDVTARRVLEIARAAFRIDTDLRPEGRDGPLVRSLDAYVAYWDRWARPWEFQSLLKARAVPGQALRPSGRTSRAKRPPVSGRVASTPMRWRSCAR